jgi:hypothetical protein
VDDFPKSVGARPDDARRVIKSKRYSADVLKSLPHSVPSHS